MFNIQPCIADCMQALWYIFKIYNSFSFHKIHRLQYVQCWTFIKSNLSTGGKTSMMYKQAFGQWRYGRFWRSCQAFVLGKGVFGGGQIWWQPLKDVDFYKLNP